MREPKDVAWFIASYARDALNRVEDAGGLPALANVRAALEEALGVTFEAERGAHFFRSTLVQTLFYASSPPGFFSRGRHTLLRNVSTGAPPSGISRCLSSARCSSRSPARRISSRFGSSRCWTGRRRRSTASTAPNSSSALTTPSAGQFFYEPFLEAFDPELRKELGVWYTPNEVVAYMVARMDKALREDLGVADGLASDQVYILDPCCGTGGFLAAVLRKIDASLDARGLAR